MAGNNVLKIVSTTKSRVSELPVSYGQLIFCKDVRTIYFDTDERVEYNQIMIFSKEAHRLASIPVCGFYFVQETNILWRYDEKWIQLTSSPKEQIVFLPKDQFPSIGDINILYIDGTDMYRWTGDNYNPMGAPVWGSFS